MMIAIAHSLAITSYGQEIKVKSFSMQMEPMTVPMQRKDNNGDVLVSAFAVESIRIDKVCEANNMDLSARTNPRQDLNGKNCALIKVYLPIAGVRFQGNVIGEVTYLGSEYWVYISEGTKEFRINSPSANPIHVNFTEWGIEKTVGSNVYEIYCSIKTSGNSGYTQEDFVESMSSRQALIDKRKYNEAIASLEMLMDSIAPFGIEMFTNTVSDRINLCRRHLALKSLQAIATGDPSCERVVIKKDNKYGVVDEVGNIIVYPEYEYIEPYKNDVAWVNKKGKYGAVSKSGAVKIPIEYSSKSIITYDQGKDIPQLMLVSKDDINYGVIDCYDGSVKLPFIYGGNRVGILGENEEAFCLYNNKTKRTVLYDSQNCKEIASLKKDIIYCEPLNYGLGLVMKDQGKSDNSFLYKFGIIDSMGNEVAACEYQISNLPVGSNMDDNLIDIVMVQPTKNDGVDPQTRLFSLKSRDYLNDRHYSHAYRQWRDWIIVSIDDQKNEFFGLVNRYTGEEKINPYKPVCNDYNFIYLDEDEKLLINGYHKKNYIFENEGTMTELPENEVEYLFYGGLAEFRKNRKSGFIDSNGNIVIAPTYDAVEPFKIDYNENIWKAKVELDGATYEIDRNGNRI